MLKPESPSNELVLAAIKEPEDLSVAMTESGAQLSSQTSLLDARGSRRPSTHSYSQWTGRRIRVALGGAGMSCNIVAATYHDHTFLPIHLAEKGMHELRWLQVRRSTR